MKLIFPILLFWSNFVFADCIETLNLKIKNPQSYRYKIDSIMHYSSSDGKICIKRISNEKYFDVFLIHPYEIDLLAVARFNIDQKPYTLDYGKMASYLICNGSCSEKVNKLMIKNKDFLKLEKEVRSEIISLKSPIRMKDERFKDNAKSFINYLESKNE